MAGYTNFFDGPFFDGPFFDAQSLVIGGGGSPSQGYSGHEVQKQTKEDIRKSREKFGVIPKQVERIIEEVSKRQALRDEQDKQKQYDELAGELKLKGIELESIYLESLSLEREIKISEKMSLLRRKQSIALILLASD